MKSSIIVLLVLAATWVITMRGQEIYYATPGVICLKDAKTCAMDRAYCKGGSCDWGNK